MLIRLAALGAALAAFVAAPTAADAATLKAPKGLAPAAGATVEAAPSFTWKRVPGADQYEFQAAADPKFGSVVDKGSFKTKNTAASLRVTLADSTYYWRVRAIDANKKAGRWTTPQRFVKSWTAAPQLVEPSDALSIQWPAAPLVLRWTTVPHATKYGVVVATDPSLSNPVIGTLKRPLETQGTTFALKGALAAGRYYWAVTPINQGGFRGRPSELGSFVWNWSTGSETQGRPGPRVLDLNPSKRTETDQPQLVNDPLLEWDAIPGAAKYEVEVNPTPEHTVGSRVFLGFASGPSISPTVHLPNNTYYWRVRAVDTDGNAGRWIDGPSFRREFAHVTQADAATQPTVQGFKIGDNLTADLTTTRGAVPATDSPLFTWQPVRGATQYELQFTRYSEPGGRGYCDWGAHVGDYSNPIKRTALTPNNAWTPGPLSVSETKATVAYPGSSDWPRSVEHRNPFSMVGTAPGTRSTWCIRVLAWDQGTNISEWTYVNASGQPTDPNRPAFTFVEPDHADRGQPASDMPASDHHPLAGSQPFANGSYTPRTPYFTWNKRPDAASYWVIVAKDAEFTEVVDVALTRAPVYAPRIDYKDEGTQYHWAVMPAGKYAPTPTQTWAANPPTRGAGRTFVKSSIKPTLMSPESGGNVGLYPVFRWRGESWPGSWPHEDRLSVPAVESAATYRLQVATDPEFKDLVDDVTTASTAYSSPKAYPADANLYWRVRANLRSGIALNWSNTGVFTRQLAAPVPFENPTAGETIPVLKWHPVPGAISYDMHLVQADGTTKVFTDLRSPRFTPVLFYGLGIWQWKVRANFPGKTSFQHVNGPFSPPQNYVRRLNPPQAVKVDLGRDRMRFTWEPDQAGYQYRLDISNSDSFAKIVDSVITPTTSFAPLLTKKAYVDGGPLWWRIAVMDEGRNVGGFTTGKVTLPKAMRATVAGTLRRGRTGRLRVTVRDLTGKALRKAGIAATGAGARPAKARTGKTGVGRLRIRATKRGTVTVRVKLRGYTDGVVKVRVR